jgi:hypothetical protein
MITDDTLREMWAEELDREEILTLAGLIDQLPMDDAALRAMRRAYEQGRADMREDCEKAIHAIIEEWRNRPARSPEDYPGAARALDAIRILHWMPLPTPPVEGGQ